MANPNVSRIGVVVVSHGQFATELLNAAEMIVGDLPGFTAVSIGWHDDVTVARDLTTPAPVVACATAAGTAVACTGTGTAVPATVSLTFTVHNPASAAGGSYSVSLTGTRRQSQ